MQYQNPSKSRKELIILGKRVTLVDSVHSLTHTYTHTCTYTHTLNPHTLTPSHTLNSSSHTGTTVRLPSIIHTLSTNLVLSLCSAENPLIPSLVCSLLYPIHPFPIPPKQTNVGPTSSSHLHPSIHPSIHSSIHNLTSTLHPKTSQLINHSSFLFHFFHPSSK